MTIKTLKQEAPKCGNCNKNIEDQKRFAFVFTSKIHPALIFDKNTDFPLDFYEEYTEEKTFITIKCPTLKCQSTFEFGQ